MKTSLTVSRGQMSERTQTKRSLCEGKRCPCFTGSGFLQKSRQRRRNKVAFVSDIHIVMVLFSQYACQTRLMSHSANLPQCASQTRLVSHGANLPQYACQTMLVSHDANLAVFVSDKASVPWAQSLAVCVSDSVPWC